MIRGTEYLLPLPYHVSTRGGPAYLICWNAFMTAISSERHLAVMLSLLNYMLRRSLWRHNSATCHQHKDVWYLPCDPGSCLLNLFETYPRFFGKSLFEISDYT